LPVIVDTNVLIGAALWPESTPAKAFEHALLEDRLHFSEVTFAEFAAVLNRPKFDRYLDALQRDRFLALVRAASSFVEIRRMVRACRDPKDDKFLEVATNGRADTIVTGDADLLVLHPFEGVEIVTPAAYLARVAG
jgi:putative PIN family toxin of toxin-antitoxin system